MIKSTKQTSRPLMALLRRMNIITMVLVSAVVSLVVFIALLVLFSVFIRSSGGTMSVSGWDMLEGFASVFTVALLLGGGLFALTEYIESEETRKEQAALTAFNLYQNIFDKMTNPEEIEARRWILQNIPQRRADEPMEAWVAQVQEVVFAPNQAGIPEGQMHVKQVLNTYDFLGFVARNYWDMDEAVLNWMSPMVAKVWDRLGAYIAYQAEERNEPDYYEDARYLGDYCINWREQLGMPDPRFTQTAV
jgi:heme/copper-type cytochrome/quinol oxidase subunit 2